MRVLLVNDYATPTAGAERITLELRDALRARGHEVRVFASRAELIPGDSFADASCFGTNTRLQTLTSTINLSASRALARELRDFPPDVVQVQMFLWQLSPAILPLLRGIPSVYWVMTYKSVCPTGLKWLPSGAPCTDRAGAVCLTGGCLTLAGIGPLMLQRNLWRRARSAFDAIVCCSSAVQRELEADGVATREVIWPGVKPAGGRGSLRSPPTVTFAGRLASEKGVDVLIRAFRVVRDRQQDARLLIAGTGPAEGALRALIDRLGLLDAVEMLGQLDEAQLSGMLDQSWVHAVPSRWPEPFGLTCTEAMMHGVAVVASEIGGLAEIVQHGVTGLRVPPGDDAALADALALVLSDRSRAERLGAAGSARANELFSVDVCVARFERLYDALIHPAPKESVVG
ncbi:MAG: glycosyl transferase group 1 [Gemmatimonadetes bacterium]|nr:glycosyl transferase group 1 [Gemmatimonadota bacterium]